MTASAEDLAVLTTKRAYETMYLKLGRAPTEYEVLIFVVQCQVAALGHMLLPADEDMVRFWQLTHDIVTHMESVPRGAS